LICARPYKEIKGTGKKKVTPSLLELFGARRKKSSPAF
jgi:hypothetical protein